MLRGIVALLVAACGLASPPAASGDELPTEYVPYPAPAYQRHGPGFDYQPPPSIDPPVSPPTPRPASVSGSDAAGAGLSVPIAPVMPMPVWSRGPWFQRPYPYHFDYYRQRYGGAPAPQPANIYLPPAVYGPGYFRPSLPYGARGGYPW